MSFLATISSIRTLLRSTRSPWQRLRETLIEDLARVDTQILHPDGELGRERTHRECFCFMEGQDKIP